MKVTEGTNAMKKQLIASIASVWTTCAALAASLGGGGYVGCGLGLPAE